MKWVRFEYQNQVKYGLLQNNQIQIAVGTPFSSFTMSGVAIPVSKAKLLAPCAPSKAVCIGLNYRDHAQEMNLVLPTEPLMFLKPSSSVIGPDEAIEYPDLTQDLQYEAELAIVIGKRAKHIKAAQAKNYILGYTCANDVTARDLQKKDGQWIRGKSFDTFLPLGPCIETDVDPANIDIALLLNGELKQKSNTRQLIFTIEELIEHITAVMTLYPGDVILTGTPSGVGPMQKGDTVQVSLAGIEVLSNHIV